MEETLTHDYPSYLLQEFIKWKTPKTAAVPFSTTKFERYVTSEDSKREGKEPGKCSYTTHFEELS